jgi:hypothetical protein
LKPVLGRGLIDNETSDRQARTLGQDQGVIRNFPLVLYRAKSPQRDSSSYEREKGQYPVGQIISAERFAEILPPSVLRLGVSLTCIGLGLWLFWRSGTERRFRGFWWTVLQYGLLALGALWLFPAAR